MKYLYGLSVQAIQEFIFATNKLKEIVGASEIIKQINEIDKKKMTEISFLKHFQPDEILLNAAGNIKVVFHSKQMCQEVLDSYQKRVMQNAYGVTVSQAVVAFEGEATAYIGELEKRLKVQRNRPSLPLDMGISIMKLNAKTARPAVKHETDKATQQKNDAYDAWIEANPRNQEFKELSTFSNAKNKIAVIHIDGNGLGQLVPQLGENLSSFSVALDKATRKAFEDARDDTMDIREVVLGGDDVTLICNADNALTFTKHFLKNFEEETAKIDETKEITDKLTACAGIAYCHEKYPLHYALDLAEELCGVAKNHAEREHSCLMFHNIQGSHFQNWEKFVTDELTIQNDKQIIRCDFGPYYLPETTKEDAAIIDDFIHTVEAYRCEGSPVGKLRNWINELHTSDKNAELMLHRINTITQQSKTWNYKIMNKNLKNLNKQLSNKTLIVPKDDMQKTPIYDVLQILAATGGES